MDNSAASRVAYEEELRRANSADLSDVRNTNVVLIAKHGDETVASDSEGNAIVILIPAMVPTDADDAWEKSFQLFLCETEQIREQRYRVIYVHSGFSPPFWFGWWLLRLRSRVSYEHRKNIEALTIVHPSIGVRLMFLALRPILGSNFWRKLHYADRIEELWLDNIMDEPLVRRSIPRAVVTFESKIIQEAEDMRDLGIAMGAPLSRRENPPDVDMDVTQ